MRAWVLALGLSACASAPVAPRGFRHIRVSASQWRYSPDRIPLRAGEHVVLELVSEDRLHGFNLPVLGLRTDVKPAVVTELELVAPRAGEWPFHCDVFCGEGHEEMSGVLVVTE